MDYEKLKGEALMWMVTHGCMMGKPGKQEEGTNLSHAPFTLQPTMFPKREFEKALAIQSAMDLLVHRISMDYDFLQSTLKAAGDADDFTAHLLDIHRTVHAEGLAQPIRMGITRSDYMLDAPDGALPTARIKQVEINTISVSFASLGTSTTALHRFMAARHGCHGDESTLPANSALQGVADGLAEAWRCYGNKEAVVVMVVLPDEHNSFDQKFVEFTLWERHGIKMIRRSLADIAARGVTEKGSPQLSIDGHQVAVAYFRAGYAPEHYPTESEWAARLALERSSVIKCPSVEYHLAGAKKIQQVIADPKVLARFLSPDEAAAVGEAFTGLYPVENNPAIIQKALADPAGYVLKPQREGGGNNLYGAEMAEALSSMPESAKSGFILMDRIRAPRVPNHIVRDGKLLSAEVVSEIGVFGVIIGEAKDKVLYQKTAGHLLRSKPHHFDDGGVAAGVAVLDSPYLV